MPDSTCNICSAQGVELTIFPGQRASFFDIGGSEIVQISAMGFCRWSKIAAHLPGRTDNEIKNYWNTHIKKKLKRMGIDPVTHRPIIDQAKSKPSIAALNEATEELSGSSPTKKEILQAVAEVSCRSNESEITEEAEKCIEELECEPVREVAWANLYIA